MPTQNYTLPNNYTPSVQLKPQGMRGYGRGFPTDTEEAPTVRGRGAFVPTPTVTQPTVTQPTYEPAAPEQFSVYGPQIDLGNSAATTGIASAPASTQTSVPGVVRNGSSFEDTPERRAAGVAPTQPQGMRRAAVDGQQFFAPPPQQAAAPDYSGQINQLINQAGYTGDAGSFDSMLAAKHTREGARAGLQAVGGMQQNATESAASANKNAVDVYAAQQNAIGEAAQAQAEQEARDRTFGLQASEFGLKQASGLASAKQQAAEQALAAGKQTDLNTKEGQRAAQEQAQRQGVSELVAAQLGLKRGEKGYETPTGFFGLTGGNPASEEDQARINAALTGTSYRDILGAPPAR